MMKRVFLPLVIVAVSIVQVYGQIYGGDLVEDIPSQGAKNAIMRAYQMTDLVFTPLHSFYANPDMSYQKGKKYQGLVYSSVKETHTFVGMDVSFHTFMTALHNPKSVMYTENVSKSPYHGRNCGAYYGTVCSGLVTYALGMKVYKKTYDYPSCDLFELVEDQSSKGVRLADVINSGGHVQLVTGIRRNPHNNKAEEIEICEAVREGCRRVILSGEELDKLLSRKKKRRKLYRYKYLDSVRYSPLTEFVTVGDEKRTPFKYNDDICTNRGDKSCYIIGDTVVLNITKGYKNLEIFKDSTLYKSIIVEKDADIILTDLPYGDYKARLVKGKNQSDYTYWKVIDAHVRIDTKNNTVRFNSSNAVPVYAEFCTLSGGRPSKGVFELSDEDIRRGFVDVSSFTSSLEKKFYMKVHFECDYGRVTNKAQKWRKK